jgi:hypothetical protein
MQKAGIAEGVPQLDFGEYLIEALFTAGPVRIEAEGELPLAWAEILAFAKATRAIREPWEFETLMRMSRGYLAEKNAAVSPLRVAPLDRASKS